LIISKSLKGDYANPTQIAHKVLADRIGERDAGNKPLPSDRIQYCFIQMAKIKCYKEGCEAIGLNPETCKCIKCMKLFCSNHIGRHRDCCVAKCRFCDSCDKSELKECDTCFGFYCPTDLIKHYGRCTNKVEPRFQKCTKCSAFSRYKCPICDVYICDKDKSEHVDGHSHCRDCKIAHNLKKCDTCRTMFCELHLWKHPARCKKPLSPKILQGDFIENPEYILANGISIDFRYYLDKQIQVPLLQIFSLIMKYPETLIENIIRKDNNRRTGNQDITQWFMLKKNKDVEKEVAPLPEPALKNYISEDIIDELFIDLDDDIEEVA